MKQFHSIEKLDTAILYALELASSLSILLLAFGLISSMANVLTKGAVLTDNVFMQRIWAWTQCIAIVQPRERGDNSLTQRYRQRTLAMAAGRTHRRWTAREVLSCPLPREGDRKSTQRESRRWPTLSGSSAFPVLSNKKQAVRAGLISQCRPTQ